MGTHKKKLVNFIKELAKKDNSLRNTIDGCVKAFPALSATEEDNVIIGVACTFFMAIMD